MIGAIVLAAGSSRRFGNDKRRATLPNGNTVLRESVSNVLTVFEQVLLVLRHDDEVFARQTAEYFGGSPNLMIYCAPDSTQGMGSSLANAMTQTRDWQGCFVCLGDMPYLQSETLETLISQLSDHGDDSIVVPVFNGVNGHPVGFSSCYFGELARLNGDTGAKFVLKNHLKKVALVEVNDSGVLKDIDRREDL